MVWRQIEIESRGERMGRRLRRDEPCAADHCDGAGLKPKRPGVLVLSQEFDAFNPNPESGAASGKADVPVAGCDKKLPPGFQSPMAAGLAQADSCKLTVEGC